MDTDDCPLKIVWDELAYHAKGRDQPPATLIRLVRKHVTRRFVERAAEALADARLRASLEHWTADQLAELWRGNDKASTEGPEDLPIVVFRCGGLYMLIDGNRRANRVVSEDRSAGSSCAWQGTVMSARRGSAKGGFLDR